MPGLSGNIAAYGSADVVSTGAVSACCAIGTHMQMMLASDCACLFLCIYLCAYCVPAHVLAHEH